MVSLKSGPVLSGDESMTVKEFSLFEFEDERHIPTDYDGVCTYDKVRYLAFFIWGIRREAVFENDVELLVFLAELAKCSGDYAVAVFPCSNSLFCQRTRIDLGVLLFHALQPNIGAECDEIPNTTAPAEFINVWHVASAFRFEMLSHKNKGCN